MPGTISPSANARLTGRDRAVRSIAVRWRSIVVISFLARQRDVFCCNAILRRPCASRYPKPDAPALLADSTPLSLRGGRVANSKEATMPAVKPLFFAEHIGFSGHETF